MNTQVRSGADLKVLVIDNFDSFTHNICQYLSSSPQFRVRVTLVKNNEWDENELRERLSWIDAIVLSPGPGTPTDEKDFGICSEAIRQTKVPLLGVCLGFQGLCHLFGSKIVRAAEPMHGRISNVFHDSPTHKTENAQSIFDGVPSPFAAVRYHSLIVQEIPESFIRLAWTEDGILMGARHKSMPLHGVQFHPESICTESGRRILENFLSIAHQHKLSHNHSLDSCISEQEQSLRESDWNTNCSSPDMHRSFTPPPNENTPSPSFEIPNLLHEPRSFHYHIASAELHLDSQEIYTSLLAASSASFWLDSSRVECGLSRFSFMGASDGPLFHRISYDVRLRKMQVCSSIATSFPVIQAIQNADIFTNVQVLIDYVALKIQNKHATKILPFDFHCGYVGYFGYEVGELCGMPPCSSEAPDFLENVPDAFFLFCDRLLVVDHRESRVYAVELRSSEFIGESGWAETVIKTLSNHSPINSVLHGLSSFDDSHQSQEEPIHFSLERSKNEYIADIHTCFEKLRSGDSYEVCLTNKIVGSVNDPSFVQPLQAYLQLRKLNPAPYAAFINFGENISLACSSPERFLKIDGNHGIQSKPIKGTLPRGKTPEEDQKLKLSLENDEKSRSENLMIVDLIRNDLGIICKPGSVVVSKLMHVETYATVHQLISNVDGQLRTKVTATEAIRQCFPPGSMTGAPKKRTVEILQALEKSPRGVYSGTLGFLSLTGPADFAVVIRTITFSPQGFYIGTGGAIIVMSDAESEFDEIVLKGQAPIRSILRAAMGPKYSDDAAETAIFGLPGTLCDVVVRPSDS
eukprot:TRINITY_DN8274_c0_g1_i1.p1 TRINITY_DN8274_c0_g1~~TRINITY_DN8274_c0_g1_i1.p1  ORF type:complete len:805 (+),score=170.70 TRINITY_DN8274_c0_g1_i1:49-2463(+)